MKFSLVICTYMRPKAVLTLLKSVEEQELYSYRSAVKAFFTGSKVTKPKSTKRKGKKRKRKKAGGGCS